MMNHDTSLCRSITMEFQPWKDYFQLASLVQKMARMNAAAEEPDTSSLRYSAESTESQAKGDDPIYSDCPTYLTPSEYEHSVSSKPHDPYYEAGLYSSHNLNSNKHLAYYQYQPMIDNNFETEPDALQYKSSQVHPTSLVTKREARSRNAMCHFCKHNGESRHVYTGHNLKNEQGKVICPILRMYTCSLCGATGESAHTKKYCPMNKNNDNLYRKAERTSAGHGLKH
ncbi:uncharacterized protein LOC130291798 [Hyla sarda]|uniref:uncharacterized protein LOC130291798 n=1 Tax=Hyla sarda TaxID=327740 RepID=UPI0024C20FB0|nr:uncharacterized protein LOC130291798 [Hyla sarda]